MTPLNGPALEKALEAFWNTPVDIACADTDENQEICVKAAITAYRDALPQSGLAALPTNGLATRLESAAHYLRPVGLFSSHMEAIIEAANYIRTSLISGVEIPGWRTIDSAPKDGTRILLHADWDAFTQVCFWSSEANDWALEWDHSTLGEAFNPLTHWKPLDLPPPTGDEP